MKILYVEDDGIYAWAQAEQAVAIRPDLDFHHGSDYAFTAQKFREKGPFDLVISDYRVPGRTPGSNGGADLYQLVAGSVPFLFLSNSAPAKIIADLHKRGLSIDPQDIFPKSLSSNSLLKVIERAQDKYRIAPRRLPGALKPFETSATGGDPSNIVFGPWPKLAHGS